MASRDELRRRRINTRDSFAAATEYCERHGIPMPLEFMLSVMGGMDPCNLWAENIDMKDRIAAGREAMKVIYIPASRVEVSAEAEVSISGVKVSDKDIVSLAQKLEKLRQGLDITNDSEEIDFDDL